MNGYLGILADLKVTTEALLSLSAQLIFSHTVVYTYYMRHTLHRHHHGDKYYNTLSRRNSLS